MSEMEERAPLAGSGRTMELEVGWVTSRLALAVCVGRAKPPPFSEPLRTDRGEWSHHHLVSRYALTGANGVTTI